MQELGFAGCLLGMAAIVFALPRVKGLRSSAPAENGDAGGKSVTFWEKRIEEAVAKQVSLPMAQQTAVLIEIRDDLKATARGINELLVRDRDRAFAARAGLTGD